jgi:hypothetical protein
VRAAELLAVAEGIPIKCIKASIKVKVIIKVIINILINNIRTNNIPTVTTTRAIIRVIINLTRVGTHIVVPIVVPIVAATANLDHTVVPIVDLRVPRKRTSPAMGVITRITSLVYRAMGVLVQGLLTRWLQGVLVMPMDKLMVITPTVATLRRRMPKCTIICKETCPSKETLCKECRSNSSSK